MNRRAFFGTVLMPIVAARLVPAEDPIMADVEKMIEHLTSNQQYKPHYITIGFPDGTVYEFSGYVEPLPHPNCRCIVSVDTARVDFLTIEELTDGTD